ncbi:MAG TPA: substrate-binding domain-containing protein, partial [Roseiflexaceae bacterium]|nr:substrate-binding domain-containing protein [Roseiflexaceae bacterium]
VQGTPRDLLTSQLAWDEADGWVVILDTDGLDDRRWAGVPFVTVDAYVPELGGYAVLPDNEGGVKAAVEHLAGHGHTRIGFVGYLEQNDIQQRFAGYQAGLAAQGIAFDPHLVFAASDNIESGGRAAAQQFLDGGAPCTALVAATDLNAVGLVEIVQAAGMRIPEDLAVTGFDNIPSAQLLSPPLATVAQRFETLGSTAAGLLLDLIAGRDVAKGITRTATTLLPRRSCGCSSAFAERFPFTPAEQAAGSWQEALATNLVRLLYYPAQVEESNAREQLGAAATLARGLAGALAGSVPAAQQLERAWRVLGAHTSDLELLHTLVQRLKQAADQQLAELQASPAARRNLDAFLDLATVEM